MPLTDEEEIEMLSQRSIAGVHPNAASNAEFAPQLNAILDKGRRKINQEDKRRRAQHQGA